MIFFKNKKKKIIDKVQVKKALQKLNADQLHDLLD